MSAQMLPAAPKFPQRGDFQPETFHFGERKKLLQEEN